MFSNQSRKIFLSPKMAEDSPDFSFAPLADSRLGESQSEGQLAVDVAQTDDELIVVAAMAGTPPENIELHLHNDLLTIRGERESPLRGLGEHFYQECYWGKFSRSIVLPVDVRAELVKAEYSNGILIIKLPKANQNSDIPIMVIEE